MNKLHEAINILEEALKKAKEALDYDWQKEMAKDQGWVKEEYTRRECGCNKDEKCFGCDPESILEDFDEPEKRVVKVDSHIFKNLNFHWGFPDCHCDVCVKKEPSLSEKLIVLQEQLDVLKTDWHDPKYREEHIDSLYKQIV